MWNRSRLTRSLIVFCVFFLYAILALGAPPAERVLPPARGVIVKFKSTTSSAERTRTEREHGLSRHGRIKELDVDIYDFPAEDTAEAVVDRLKKKFGDTIEYAEPDRIVRLAFIPNDPQYSAQWEHAVMHTPQAWDTTRGEGVIIAIIDTGIDETHPDLAASIIPGINTFDNTTNVSDVFGHGTMAAGVAAAIGNNGVGVAGVAFNSQILVIRADDGAGYSTYSALVNGLIYAADHGARVANLSWDGICYGATMAGAGNYMRQKGGVTVVAAGNSGAEIYGTDLSSLTCVAATDANDNYSSWSNYGGAIDVSAPGESLLTTEMGGGYNTVSGTSFSSPTVAGVFALVFSANPNLTPEQAQKIVYSTAQDLGTPGYDQRFGYGRVDAARAVELALVTGAPSTDITPPTAPSNLTAVVVVPGGSQVDLAWSPATDDIGVTGYMVYRNGARLGSSTTTTYSDVSAKPLSSLAYSVAALDAAGNISTTSNSATVFTPADTVPPSAPANLIAQPLASGQILFSCKAQDSVGVAGYNIYRNGSKYVTAVLTCYLTDGAVLPSTTYQYSAEAYDAAGNMSPMSATISATTLPDTVAPTVPTLLTATVNITMVNLTWTASVDNTGPPAGYKIIRNGSVIASINALAYTDVSGSPSTTYQYAIAAFDSAGNTSAPSNSITVTTGGVADTTPPTSPSSVVAQALAPASVNVTWLASTDNVGVVTYSIYRNGAFVSSVASPSLSFSDSGVQPYTAYAYTVTAKDQAGNESAPSAAANVVTPAGTALVISNVAVRPASTTAVITWTTNRTASGVVSYQRTSGGTIINVPVPAVTVNHSVTISGLARSTTYKLWISSTDIAGATVSYPQTTFRTTR